jgi:hypothetical protein
MTFEPACVAFLGPLSFQRGHCTYLACSAKGLSYVYCTRDYHIIIIAINIIIYFIYVFIFFITYFTRKKLIIPTVHFSEILREMVSKFSTSS